MESYSTCFTFWVSQCLKWNCGNLELGFNALKWCNGRTGTTALNKAAGRDSEVSVILRLLRFNGDSCFWSPTWPGYTLFRTRKKGDLAIPEDLVQREMTFCSTWVGCHLWCCAVFFALSLFGCWLSHPQGICLMVSKSLPSDQAEDICLPVWRRRQPCCHIYRGFGYCPVMILSLRPKGWDSATWNIHTRDCPTQTSRQSHSTDEAAPQSNYTTGEKGLASVFTPSFGRDVSRLDSAEVLRRPRWCSVKNYVQECDWKTWDTGSYMILTFKNVIPVGLESWLSG